MIDDKPPGTGAGAVLLAAAFFAAIACLFHLASARAGHPLYRDQHLGTAVYYAQTKIDLLRPIIVGFNATQTPTPQELPVWQAASAFAFKLLRLLVRLGECHLAHFVLHLPLAALSGGARLSGPTVCRVDSVFFLAQPIVFFFSGVGGTDGFSLASMVWFLYFA